MQIDVILTVNGLFQGILYTHRLGVDRMHRKEQSCDERQSAVLEDRFIAGIHQDEGHQAVQNDIDRMEVERVHASQKYV